MKQGGTAQEKYHDERRPARPLRGELRDDPWKDSAREDREIDERSSPDTRKSRPRPSSREGERDEADDRECAEYDWSCPVSQKVRNTGTNVGSRSGPGIESEQQAAGGGAGSYEPMFEGAACAHAFRQSSPPYILSSSSFPIVGAHGMSSYCASPR
jgi:hypothetical protein